MKSVDPHAISIWHLQLVWAWFPNWCTIYVPILNSSAHLQQYRLSMHHAFRVMQKPQHLWCHPYGVLQPWRKRHHTSTTMANHGCEPGICQAKGNSFFGSFGGFGCQEFQTIIHRSNASMQINASSVSPGFKHTHFLCFSKKNKTKFVKRMV